MVALLQKQTLPTLTIRFQNKDQREKALDICGNMTTEIHSAMAFLWPKDQIQVRTGSFQTSKNSPREVGSAGISSCNKFPSTEKGPGLQGC